MIEPAAVIRPISLAFGWANQRLPSGPAAMADGAELVVGIGNSVTVPAGVMRAISFPIASVNQMLPVRPGGDPGRNRMGMRNRELRDLRP